MTFKKIIAAVTSASVIFTTFTSVTAAAPELVSNITTVKSSMVRPTKETDMLWETFENGEEANWYFRNSTNSSARKAEILSENGNKFMRYTVDGSWTTSYANSATTTADAIHPLLSRSFEDGAVIIDNTQYSVFEFDFRTTENNVSNVWMNVNFPYLGEKMPDGTAYNKNENGLGDTGYRTRVHFTLEGDKAGFTTKDNYAGSAFRGQPSVKPYDAVLSKNKWYRMRYVYNNPQKTVSVFLYDIEEETLLGSLLNQELSAWWYEYYNSSKTVRLPRNEIYDITIRYGGFGGDNVKNQFDIDNIKIYSQKPVVKAAVIPNTDIGIVYKPTEVSFKFDGAAVIPGGSVTIKNEAGAEITHSGSYNEVTRTYTADFGTVLPSGNYTIVLGDAARPLNSTEGGVFSMSFESREIPLTVYDTMPPSAQNVVISGRNIRGTVIEADYDYVSEAGNEGESVYEWYVSSNGTDGWTKLDSESFKELDVTQSGVYGKYIKFKVKPISDMGLEGQFYESNIIIPEAAPVAENVALSAETLFPNSYIEAVYDYSDINNDGEGASETKWYSADSAEGEWSLIYTGSMYNITDADIGKYIKCAVTPVAVSTEEKRGLTVESAPAGPVADILESTNMLLDAGFESGVLEPNWVWGTREDLGGSWEGVSLQDYDTHNGSGYALYMPPRTIVNDSWGQRVAIEQGKTYVQGAWVKLSNNKFSPMGPLWPYVWDSMTRGDAEGTFDYTLNHRWQQLAGSFIANATNSNILVGPVAFEGLTSISAHIDDMYFGELLVADITTYEQEPVEIPSSGTTSVIITNGIPLNQLGTQHGLWNDKAYVRVPEGTQGVTVDGNNIVISNTAVEGTLNVEVYCEPTFSGASQSVFRKFVSVELVAGSDISPKALDVNVSGTYAAGSTLTGSYTFYQANGKADASDVRWMYSDSENGVYYDIPDAITNTYTIDSLYADKYIKFVVTPKTADDLVGTDTYSAAVTKPRAPVAKDLKITGEFVTGGTIKAEYTHHDPNGDARGASVYEWYIADSKSGNYTLIEGANTDELVLTDEMTDKFIKFKVTPVSNVAPTNGAKAESEAVQGPAVPQALNVRISQVDSRLTASYFYYHPHNVEEGKSVYKWTVDGVTVSQEADYAINFSGTKTVTFTVIPVSVGTPSTGKAVSVSAVITGSAGASTGGPVGGVVVGGGVSGGSGGGGGGGSTSSGSGVGVTNINDMNLADPNAETEKPEEPKTQSDLTGHWGEEYVTEMAERGVMVADENGSFKPDEFVSREEMLTYLFKALGLDTTEYKNEFSDVKDGEFAKMLQTMVDNGTIAKDVAFRPNDTISREEMCKILYISLENAGKLTKPEEIMIEGFSDYSSISDWAVDYVNAIYSNKIMVGVSDTEFEPSGTVTRAQAATMLVRILRLTEEAE